MVFKWRGKSSGTPEAEGATSTGSETAEGLEAGTHSARVDMQLENFRKQHKWDPFLDIKKLDLVDEVLRSGDVEKEAAVEVSLLEEDSPYPEVRASVCRPC